MSGPKRQLTCACCGSDAGKWHQHFNQDTGYGVCARCRDWIQARGMDPGEFRQSYGKPGVNYEAKQVHHFGRLFTVLAEFPEQNVAAVNRYCEQYPGAAVLVVGGGWAILADVSDTGVPVKETK